MPPFCIWKVTSFYLLFAGLFGFYSGDAMKILRAAMLSIFLIMQLVFPLRAYAFAPVMGLAYAAGSAALQAGARYLVPAVGLAVGGYLATRFDGEASSLVPDWPTKSGADGKPYSVPPPTTKPEVITGNRINYWIRGVVGPFVSVPAGAPIEYYYDQLKRLCTSVPGNNYVYGEGHCRDSISRIVPVDNSGIVNDNSLTCPVGYMMSANNTCDLSHPDLAQKPSGTPCDITFSGGTFKADPKNPGCSGVTSFERGPCTFKISGSSLSGSCTSGEEITIGAGNIEYKTPAGTYTGTLAGGGVAGGTADITLPGGILGLPGSIPGAGSGAGAVPGTGTGTGTGAGDTPAETPQLDLSSITSAITSGVDVIKAAISSAVSSVVNAVQGIATAVAAVVSPIVAPLVSSVTAIKDFVLSDEMPEAGTESISNDDVPISLQPQNKYFTGGGCPEPKRLSVNIMGKETELVFEYTPLCDLSLLVKPFFVLIGYYFAARTIFRGNA